MGLINLEEIHEILDKDGLFLKGPYRGLNIVPVLEAMSTSAWDYPFAMSQVGKVLGVREWTDCTYWPLRLPEKVELYAHLQLICPKANWSDAPVGWDT